MGRHIQRLKAVMVCLYLGAFHNVKSHSEKDLLHVCQHRIQRVGSSDGRCLAGQCNVKSFVLEPHLLGCGFKLVHPFIQSSFYIRPDLICKLAHGRSFLRRKLTHLFEYTCDLAFFAKVLHPELFKAFCIAYLFKTCLCTLFNTSELFLHSFYLPIIIKGPVLKKGQDH